MAVLEVRNLSVRYRSGKGNGYALRDVSFNVGKEDIVGLVGESGCGKSTLAWSIIRMLPPAARIVEGKILLEDRNLLDFSPDEMAGKIRGKEVSIIPQNPQAAFNPTFQIGTQIVDVLRFSRKSNHKRSKKAQLDLAVEWLERVGISDPQKRIRDYPHQFSGGMKQRVMIAMAFITDPTLLIADEPTTALDVTLEAQILELLKETIVRSHTSTIYITHDLGVVNKLCKKVVIMYAGRIVEMGEKDELFRKPLHPYTRALLKCIPGKSKRGEQLPTIPGSVTSIFDLSPGCKFYPRCSNAKSDCAAEEPELHEIQPSHFVRCFDL